MTHPDVRAWQRHLAECDDCRDAEAYGCEEGHRLINAARAVHHLLPLGPTGARP